MIKGVEAILIGSENPRKLAEFYEKTVGLKLSGEFEMGENNEEVFNFEEIEGANLYIMHHSQIKGTNSEPGRIMFNLEVFPIEDEVNRVQDAGAKLIKNIYHIEGYGKIATFEDPDGNYFQLVQIREG